MLALDLNFPNSKIKVGVRYDYLSYSLFFKKPPSGGFLFVFDKKGKEL